MSFRISHSRVAASRILGALAWGVALAVVVACHHRPSSVSPETADYRQVQKQGGRVSALEAEELNQRSVAQMEELLDGRVAGLHVIRTLEGGFVVRIRGVGSLIGGAEPLYVIDGIPTRVDPRRGLHWLSPRDIRSIVVLKGPPETSMYGVRGANGVILITTR